MCLASATSSPTACSAAETTVDSGAFATTIPRRVAASTSTLSTPRPTDHLQPVGPLEDIGGQLRRGADDDRVVVPDPLLERQVTVDVDLELLAQELDSGLGDRLANEDPEALGHTLVCSKASSAAVMAAPRSMSAPSSASTSSTPASAVVMSKTS